MRCRKHHYVYTQGYFYCTKCGHRRYHSHRGRRKTKKIIIVPIIVVLVGIVVYFYSDIITNFSNELPKIPKTLSVKIIKPIESAIKDAPKSVNIPSIQIKQYTLDELRQIALEDINNYRNQHGLHAVTLGNARAPQLYAEVLLAEGCIHHIADNGDDPIMRYKRAGDDLFMVAENLSGGYGTRYMTPDESVKDANHGMMFEDEDQGNGHRDNILNPNHNSVSLGIAYDSQRLILVEDFEDPFSPNYSYTYASGKSCW